jgi:hypothetical protein
MVMGTFLDGDGQPGKPIADCTGAPMPVPIAHRDNGSWHRHRCGGWGGVGSTSWLWAQLPTAQLQLLSGVRLPREGCHKHSYPEHKHSPLHNSMHCVELLPKLAPGGRWLCGADDEQHDNSSSWHSSSFCCSLAKKA